MLWSVNKFSQPIFEGNIWRQVRRISMLILGLKGLRTHGKQRQPKNNLRSQGHGKSKTNHLIMTHWWQTWQKNNNLFTLISQKGDEDTGNNHWRWNFLIFKQLSLLSYLPYEQQKLPFGAFDPVNGYFFDVVDRCNHQMT